MSNSEVQPIQPRLFIHLKPEQISLIHSFFSKAGKYLKSKEDNPNLLITFHFKPIMIFKIQNDQYSFIEMWLVTPIENIKRTEKGIIQLPLFLSSFIEELPTSSCFENSSMILEIFEGSIKITCIDPASENDDIFQFFSQKLCILDGKFLENFSKPLEEVHWEFLLKKENAAVFSTSLKENCSESKREDKHFWIIKKVDQIKLKFVTFLNGKFYKYSLLLDIVNKVDKMNSVFKFKFQGSRIMHFLKTLEKKDELRFIFDSLGNLKIMYEEEDLKYSSWFCRLDEGAENN
jgi:hypothetical protein